MKNSTIFIVIVTIITIWLFCSCQNARGQISSYNDINTESTRGTTKNVLVRRYLNEEECNGHIYVIASNRGMNGGIAMMRSPNCPCQKQRSK